MKNKSFKTLLLSMSSLLIISGNAGAATKLEQGIELYRSGNYDQAINILKQASQDEPENPEPHIWLQKCYEGTFDLDKAMNETKIYNKLKSEYNKKKKAEEEARLKAEEEARRKKEEMAALKKSEGSIQVFNDDFLRMVIAKRDSKNEVRNLRYLSLKELNELINKVPKETELLKSTHLEYEFKDYYGVATHQDLIVLNKARASILELKLSSKKFELSQEEDEYQKKAIQKEIDKIIDEHKELMKKSEKLINTAILPDTDPLSFNYYQNLEVSPEEHIKYLERKKSRFFTALEKSDQQINNYKSIIVPQEKELNLKKESIEPSLLNANITGLSGYERELVSSYRSLEEKIHRDKASLFNYIQEQNLLINSIIEANETIKKIDPEYINNDPPLPKLIELKVMDETDEKSNENPEKDKKEITNKSK